MTTALEQRVDHRETAATAILTTAIPSTFFFNPYRINSELRRFAFYKQVEILVESERDEVVLKTAMEVGRDDAIEYNMRMHVFHAGRVRKTPRLTLR